MCFHGWSKTNVFHSFWRLNFPFLLHNCSDLGSRLGFKADKFHSIVIIKGRSMNPTPFSVSKATNQPKFLSSIFLTYSRPVKLWGWIIHGSISERNSSAELGDKLLAGLRIIDKSHLTSTQKLRILQHLHIPRIQWLLLI